ncbi:hypothetical protein [Dongia rigui]|uniref:Uncharacterized protein n=1 Tax=Dongia rigui TaxID=940149 RepID=A0ABU5E0L3_9PROT|nr:hypothetical protein [Dongia rigui]MDY0872749.1 hypothetical protein [Dongia rigui]
MAPVNPRPRPYAERPSGPLTPKPANDNVLGTWENGVFRFASPEAKEKWRRKSYEQGVGEETWHLGKEMDSQSVDLMKAGLGGANAAFYQAPDGTYRRMNPKTIESQEARDHRSKYLVGKTIDQIAKANGMPGADQWVAKGREVPDAANDNAAGLTALTPIQSLKVPSAEDKKPPSAVLPIRTDQGAGQMMAGRFGAMKPALESADKQSADDLGRIAVNAVLGNYGDEARAALGATSSLWDGKSFAETYDSNLQVERQATAAAQERQGLTGTGVELLTSFIPIVGDASGALADFKDWQEHGDEWGWSDYGLVALGLIPEMPNRKAVKGAEKIGEELIEVAGEAGDEIAGLGKKGSKVADAAEAAKVNYKALVEEAKSKVYLEGDARKLDRSTRGIIYVKEKAGGTEAAKEFMKTHPDVIYDAENDMFHVPAICYDNPNPNGYPFIKLDAASVFGENIELVLTDVKTKMAIWNQETQNKARVTLGRLQSALRQNPGIKVHYQFKTREAAEAAQNFLEANDFADIVVVTVREQ